MPDPVHASSPCCQCSMPQASPAAPFKPLRLQHRRARPRRAGNVVNLHAASFTMTFAYYLTMVCARMCACVCACVCALLAAPARLCCSPATTPHAPRAPRCCPACALAGTSAADVVRVWRHLGPAHAWAAVGARGGGAVPHLRLLSQGTRRAWRTFGHRRMRRSRMACIQMHRDACCRCIGMHIAFTGLHARAQPRRMQCPERWMRAPTSVPQAAAHYPHHAPCCRITPTHAHPATPSRAPCRRWCSAAA